MCFGKPYCSQARTRQHRESSGAERAGGAAKRAAKRTDDERELPARRSVKEWPANREARGRLTLRASADPHAEGFYARHGGVRVGRRDSVVIAGRSLPVLAIRLDAE